ncbi:MAG: CDP-alcohol phosphatidyltransferase family protein [Myxococcales bacterium]|nr:CDP-alcohol phosphatidyltransferase family protein [Myxococcales bacterium]
MPTTPKLPAFESLLKSRDVEDPVNLWVHRPLAYAFVALIYRTPLTPNMVTLMAMLVGIAAGVLWFRGGPEEMVWGGVLLWLSAILDGADGILARAKQQFSEMGRALDGSADSIVALATVAGAFYHLWTTQGSVSLIVLAAAAIASAVLHIELYDYYKESYMQMTDPAWDGHPERLDEVEARLPRLREQGAGLATRFAMHMYIGLVTGQARVVRLTNPWGLRHEETYTVSAESVESYRRHNRWPIRLWAMVSLAPHSYLMAICGMLDQLEVYLWLRLGAMNVIFALVLVWQRAASRAHRADLERLGVAPVAYPPAS